MKLIILGTGVLNLRPNKLEGFSHHSEKYLFKDVVLHCTEDLPSSGAWSTELRTYLLSGEKTQVRISMRPVIKIRACALLRHANTMAKPFLKYTCMLAKADKITDICTSNFDENSVKLRRGCFTENLAF